MRRRSICLSGPATACVSICFEYRQLRGELSACEPLFCERADLRLATRVLAVTPGCEELLARQKRKSVSRSSCSNAPRIRQSVHHTCMSGGKDCCSRWYS